MTLAEQNCIACKGGAPRLTGAEISSLESQVHGWQVVDQHHLTKQYKFSDFLTALAFVNRAGALAEEQGHHPDFELAWGRVGLKLWTHSVDGLTESDFILAAKLDLLYP